MNSVARGEVPNPDPQVLERIRSLDDAIASTPPRSDAAFGSTSIDRNVAEHWARTDGTVITVRGELIRLTLDVAADDLPPAEKKKIVEEADRRGQLR
jgi:hypothetical protein